MSKNHHKAIFLAVVILIISMSPINLLQSPPNHNHYSTNDKEIVEITEKVNKDYNLGYLRASDNPGNFTFTTDKDVVYKGENITFFWTASEGADNYSIYVSLKNITKIDGNSTLIKQGLTRLNYSIVTSEPGVKYYVDVAYNESGNTLSNCVKVTILELEDSDDKYYNGEILSGPLIVIFLIGIVILLSISGIISYRNRKKHISKPISGPISYVEKDNYKDYEMVAAEEVQGIKKLNSAMEILNGLIDNEFLLKSINEGRELKKFELSSVSADFLNKVDKFKWSDESQKLKFIREMLALTPEERDDITSYMMERSNKEDLFP